MQYWDLLWHFDYGSGLKMTMSQAARQKRLNRKSWPDLFIANPVDIRHGQSRSGAYPGLFLELKREGTRIYKRDGLLVANEHIKEQAAVLQELRDQGYAADFAVGLDDAIEKIDNYLKGAE
jgi:hypothetical protein